MSNKELAEELDKPIIRKFKKRKLNSSFIDNIWGTDLADMQLISNFNKEFRFLLCVIDIYSKYAWVIPLKDKKGITIANCKNFQISQNANQAKYGKRKAVHFRIDQWNLFCRIMIQKSIQCIMNKNLLLLKNLLEP